MLIAVTQIEQSHLTKGFEERPLFGREQLCQSACVFEELAILYLL